MTVLEYLLNGLNAELELERELGVRSVEITQLSPSASEGAGSESARRKSAGSESAGSESARCESARCETGDSQSPAAAPKRGSSHYDFVFIHDRPLSPPAVEMMAKIIPAMGKTVQTAPVVVAPPIPRARIYVFLGRAALARYMPDVRAREGEWFKSPKGKEIMLVKSPEEILRFTTITPAVMKMKREMWLSLKVVMQRLQLPG